MRACAALPQIFMIMEKRNKTNFRIKQCSIELYFGVPGAGKTTWAAYLASKAIKKKRPVFSNVFIKGCYMYDKEDLGVNLIENALVIVDEAGLEFDNRKMSMKDSEIYFFKYHRHYQNDIVFFSQGLDVDIKIRKLAQKLYLLGPSLLPGFILRKTIDRRVGIDDNGQIIDKFSFRSPLFGGYKLIFAPAFRKYFNTLDRKALNLKQFPVYR